MPPRTRSIRSALAALGLFAAMLAVVTMISSPATSEKPEKPETSAPASTEDYAAPRVLGKIGIGAITECSGIAASRKNPGVLWLHNDSGDSPRLFALDGRGELVAEVEITGARHRDWEDIALGPGPRPGVDYLWIGDFGNNARNRSDLCIYRLREPALKGLARGKRWKSEAATRFSFEYPEGSYDCESLAVHPKTGDVFIITKDYAGAARVFRVEIPEAKTGARARAKLELVTKLRLSSATGADFSPDGTRLVIRTYFGVFERRLAEGRPIAEIFNASPIALPAPVEKIGEAICYRPDGGIVTVSEGQRVPMYLLRRR